MTKIMQGIEELQKGLCLLTEGFAELLDKKEGITGTWLTRTEAAELLQVSKATISKIAREMQEAGSPGVISSPNFLRLEQEHLVTFANERR